MGEGIFYPSISSDDGYWSGTNFFNSLEGLTIGDISGNPYKSFIRFKNITIPQGSKILSAFIRYTARFSNSGLPVNAGIFFNNTDNAIAPTNYLEADNLNLTIPSIAWSIGEWTEQEQYDTPSIVSHLQTVIDRPGWYSNVMAVIWDKTSSSDRNCYSYDYNYGEKCPELHVTWSLPENITDIRTEIAADFYTGWLHLPSEVSAGVKAFQYLKSRIEAGNISLSDLLSEIKAGNLSFTDLLSEVIANAQSLTDLLSEIDTSALSIKDINSFIESEYPTWSKFLLLSHDHVPARNALNVKIGKAMQFRLYNPDPLFGIDLTTFKIRFNEGTWYRYGDTRLTFTEVSYREYLVYFNPPAFDYNSQIDLELYCEDHRNNPGIKLEIL